MNSSGFQKESDLKLDFDNKVTIGPKEKYLESISIPITTRQEAFSNWTFSEFMTVFNIKADNYMDLEKFDLPQSKIKKRLTDDVVKDIIKINKVCQGIVAEGNVTALF